jgi:hypothetical protein
MNKILTLVVAACLLSAASFGQDAKKTAPTGSQKEAPKKDAKSGEAYPFRKVSLDLSAGSRGVGIGIRYRINSRFSARMGVSTMPITYNTSITLSGYDANVDLENKFNGVQFLADFKPLEKFPLRIIAGFAWFVDALVSADLTPTGTYPYGTIKVDASTVGSVHAALDWSGVAPFIGIGIGGNKPPKHQVGFAVGVGMYYLPQPVVTITGTKFLEGNYQNQQWLSKNLEDWRYLPVLNFHLIYRLRKTN